MDAAQIGAIITVLIGAGAQAVTGIGFSLLCAPLLVVALGGSDGVRTANLLAIGVNLLLLRSEWRLANARHVLLLLIPATVVAAATARGISNLDPRALSLGCGVVVLIAVGVLAAGIRVTPLAGRSGAVLAGAVSGAMNVVGGVGGPAVAAYALNARWQVQRMRATLAMYFLGINVVSVASRGIPRLAGALFGGLVLALVLGFCGGRLLSAKLDARVVRWVILVLAGLGAGAAVAQGVR